MSSVYVTRDYMLSKRHLYRCMIAASLLNGITLASVADAHDFWIQPLQYWSQPDASIPITLQVGHGAERQRSQIRSSRISRFVAIAPVAERKTDSSGRASFPLTARGTWLLNVVWTKPAAALADVDFDTTFSSLTFGCP